MSVRASVSSWSSDILGGGNLTVSDLTKMVKEPLPSVQTYHRSKVLRANTGINGLIASASVLFSLLGKLTFEVPCNIKDLREKLIWELKAFESAALHKGYSAEEIVLARYAICTALDMVLLNTSWGAEAWQTHTLLYFFQGERCGQIDIFTILDYLSQDIAKFIDVLAFFYVSMSLSLESLAPQNRTEQADLQNRLETLYHLIKRYQLTQINCTRTAKPQKANLSSGLPDKIKRLLCYRLSILCVVSSFCFYLFYLFAMHESTSPVWHAIQHLSTFTVA